MAYSEQELLKRLGTFRKEHGRYPSHSDFKNRVITPSRNVYYRKFGTMENVIKQAELYGRGDLSLEDEQDQKHKRSIRQEKGSTCFFCGNQIRDLEEYYSNLTRILIMRFIERLESDNGDSYFNAVLDCIHDVFGNDNRFIRQKLAAAGYLDKFERRYPINDRN